MPNAVKTIEILGPGCPRCYETYRVVKHVIDEAGLEFRVEKNASIDRLIELGVLKTPAVAIDGRIVLSGRIPKAEEVRQLLGLA